MGGGGEGGREVASEQHTKGGASVRGGRSLGRPFYREIDHRLGRVYLFPVDENRTIT